MRVYANIVILAGIAGLALPVSAQVQITEIMYDRDGTDSGYEWVELYNEGTEAIAITAWSFVENDTNHRIDAVSEEMEIAPGDRAVLADDPESFLEDTPSYVGLLFDSAFSLANTGEALSLRSAQGSLVDTVVYDPAFGADGNGASLQRQEDDIWIQGEPTPGEENTTEEYVDTEEKGTEEKDQEEDVDFATPESPWPFETDVFVNAGENRRVFENEPLTFEAKARRRNGDKVRNVDFLWVFGDGNDKRERSAEHSFRFSGTYSVVLIASVDKERYTDRAVIEVIKPEVNISEVTEESVTIENSHPYEMDIGGWSVQAEENDGKTKTITFPTYTHISPEATITIEFAVPEGVTRVELRDSSEYTVSSRENARVVQNEEIETYRARIDALFKELEK